MTMSCKTYSFPKKFRLLKRFEFRRMLYGSERRIGKFFVVDVKKNFLLHSRLGITVTKKFGKSHDRNRFKRLVRESFRLSKNSLLVGYDFNVRPRSTAGGASLHAIINELVQLIGEESDSKRSVRGATRTQPSPKKSCRNN